MDIFLVLFAIGIVIGGLGVVGLFLNLKAKPKPQEEKPEEVNCETCGVKLLKNKAHKVSFAHGYNVEYYCQAHAPKYDEVGYFGHYKSMAVDVNGEPIGYMKTSPPIAASSCTLIIPDNLITFTLTEEGEKLKVKKPKGKCK